MYANKSKLPRVLDRPKISPRTNGSKRDIHAVVTTREVGGGTQSDNGRDCCDAFIGLMHTCTKIGTAFWDYLGDRLAEHVFVE